MTIGDRVADRRNGERRRTRRPSAPPDESWFGAFADESAGDGPHGDASASGDTLRPRAPSTRDGAPADDAGYGDHDREREAEVDVEDDDDDDDDPPRGTRGSRESRLDSRFLSRTASQVVRSGQTAFERTYRAFVAARAALGVALGMALGVGGLLGVRPSPVAIGVSVAYAVLAIGLWLVPLHRPSAAMKAEARLSGWRWLATIGVDFVCFTALHAAAPGSALNFVALLVLPVLMAGVLTRRTFALALTAAVSATLLAAAWLGSAAGSDGTLQVTQAALAGAGLFVVAVLAGELSGRLAREERTARGSLAMARQQAQLNRLVIEEMQDGVLVVDRRGRVRAANPSARRLLAPHGMSRPAPFQLRGVPAWAALVKTVERAFVEAAWPEAGRDVALQFEGPSGSRPALRTLRARVRFTRRREPAAVEEFCVMFLEDVRNMQARSRQEKLAAMGRVSAGIAHEIRNPLAAISQANALLAEDVTDPAQRQLIRMVGDNAERLKRIVDDVMEVAPGLAPDTGVIDATAQVAAVCAEWAGANGVPLGEHSVLRVELPAEAVGVTFDAEHLRRVLVNLLDNAHRHASGDAAAVHLRLDSRHEAQAFLSVSSDGPVIPADVEPYLFEPFFSTRSRGTGLGLYICRELCERYGATIDYRIRGAGAASRNEFFVDMQRRPLGPTDARLHLSP